MRWWHLLLGHRITGTRVSVPLFDPDAKGLLYRCDCGKVWAV